MKNCYFAKAKKAARTAIEDTSKAHRLAMEVVRSMVPNKSDEFYAGMGWQAVLAAREAVMTVKF